MIVCIIGVLEVGKWLMIVLVYIKEIYLNSKVYNF